MNNERDELAELPASQLAFMAALKNETAFKGDGRAFRAGFDAALAWKLPPKPRTVTMAAELDALPVGSVVLDDLLVTYSKPYNAGNFWLMVGDEERHPAEHVFLPATVLHEGGAA